jgi:hemoglobin
MTDAEDIEAAIHACVRDFYDKARADPLLGPIFAAEITDWDTHLRVIDDFWSNVVLKTTRYAGQPYVLHVPLPIAHEHIERWLELFEESARKALAPAQAETVLARARTMGDSFKAGLFPFKDKDGKPSRHPV